MKRIIRLCQSIIRGTEDPHPGMIDHTCVKSPVNQQPQFPQPLLPPPQKQDRSRIQISHSQQSFPPQPLFLLPRSPQLLLPQPLPQPPPQNSKRMIQMQLLPKIPLPQLLLPQELLQPQFVAVKSLIFSASTFYLCSIVCGGACQCFRKRLAIISGYSKI